MMNTNANFKVYQASAGSGKTFTLIKEYLKLCLKDKASVGNYQNILAITFTNATANEMKEKIKSQLLDIIGTGASRRGIFEGDLDTGELEIGQVASLLQGRSQKTVAEVFMELLAEYAAAKQVVAKS